MHSTSNMCTCSFTPAQTHKYLCTPLLNMHTVLSHPCLITSIAYIPSTVTTLLCILLKMVGTEYNVRIKDTELLAEGWWADWSQDMMFCFLEMGLEDYLDGNVPGDTKKQQSNWKTINSYIIADSSVPWGRMW